MKYSFDFAKQALNVAKHGVFFATAELFEWENALIAVDRRRDYKESRLVAIGPIGKRLYVMVFTLRGVHVRIISLRKANLREARRYVHQRQIRP